MGTQNKGIEERNVLIIGGGLSGIYAASLLVAEGKDVVLLEARNRLGGRILSTEHTGYWVDLGPSWYWPAMNPKIGALINKMNLHGYPQFETGATRFETRDGRVVTMEGQPMNPPGWRLCGGMNALVSGLCRTIPRNTIRLNHPVCEIKKMKDGILVTAGALDETPLCQIKAKHIILAMPPRLAARSILFTPDLSAPLMQAMLKVSTWMAGHAKFFALFHQAPWRTATLSGQAFSYRGPLGEIHDASNDTIGPNGLTGFLSTPPLRRKEPDLMRPLILSQLEKLFGEEASRPMAFYYQDWAKEPFTATEYDLRSAHNHPEFHPPSNARHTWEGRLLFAGTETADHLAGYLEGALQSGERAASQCSYLMEKPLDSLKHHGAR